MKAAVFSEPKLIHVKEVPEPEIGLRDVLIRIKAAGICGSDLHSYKENKKDKVRTYPFTPGHEFAGDVVKIGDRVTKVKVKDRVAVEPLIGCGRCGFCISGNYHLCPELKHIGVHFSGGFAEFTSAPEDNVYNLPDSVSYDDGALLDCFAVAVHAVHILQPHISDKVAILGTGAIGLCTLQVVKAMGAEKVILVGTRDSSLKIGEHLGADVLINATKEDAVAKINSLTDGKGVTIVYECVGGKSEAFVQSLNMVSRGGSLGILGLFTEPQTFTDFRSLLRKEITIQFIYSYSMWKFLPEYQIALDLLTNGRLITQPIITHRFPLEKIEQAFEVAADKYKSGAVKVLITP